MTNRSTLEFWRRRRLAGSYPMIVIVLLGFSLRTFGQCMSDLQCHDDGNTCTCDRCVNSTCVHATTLYGNANCTGPSNSNLDDILCVLSGFASLSACPNGDIAPVCTGNDVINLDDILAVLVAFSGADPCNCSENFDADGDGWTVRNGDCCDVAGAGCGNSPELVNPGALEIVGNGIDDDCDVNTSDETAPSWCASPPIFNSQTAIDLAEAIGICQFTIANPPLETKKWGLISAQLLHPNGASPNATDLSVMQNSQVTQLFGYGSFVGPTEGAMFAGISTGKMRDANDPGFHTPDAGTDFGRYLPFPTGGPLEAYMNEHGGDLNSGGWCGGCPAASGGASDGVLLRLTIRVPTNVQSFSFDFRYFSADYHDWQCTPYVDYFLVLLTSAANGIPADKNIAFDAGGPINVNSSFFEICSGPSDPPLPSCPFNCTGATELQGTGMETAMVQGGGTPWLTTDAPVVPGEIITLDFLLFDVSDGRIDSLVLMDNFRWGLTPTVVSTHE